MVHFSSGDSDAKQATFWTVMHSCYSKNWQISRPAHLHQSDYNRETVYEAEYWLHWVGNNGSNTGISALTATSWCWLSWSLKLWIGPEMKTTFLLQHDNRTHTSLKIMEHMTILAILSYHIHNIVQILNLLTSICSGCWKMKCMGNIFLATTPS